MKKTFLLAALIILAVSPAAMALTSVLISDGQDHIFDHDTYQNDFVRLDYYPSHAPGTHVDLVDDGLVYGLEAYNSSTITMTGGEVSFGLSARDDAFISMSGGAVGGVLFAAEDADITMSGGTVGSDFRGSETSTITMSGGSVARLHVIDNSSAIMSGGMARDSITVSDNGTVTMSGGSAVWLQLWHNGIIYLDGSDFAVEDYYGSRSTISLSNDDRLSDYVARDSLWGAYSGSITGTLADGSALRIPFKIFDSADREFVGDIIIIPEPTTLALLGFGGLAIFRRMCPMQ